MLEIGRVEGLGHDPVKCEERCHESLRKYGQELYDKQVRRPWNCSVQ